VLYAFQVHIVSVRNPQPSCHKHTGKFIPVTHKHVQCHIVSVSHSKKVYYLKDWHPTLSTPFPDVHLDIWLTRFKYKRTVQESSPLNAVSRKLHPLSPAQGIGIENSRTIILSIALNSKVHLKNLDIYSFRPRTFSIPYSSPISCGLWFTFPAQQKKSIRQIESKYENSPACNAYFQSTLRSSRRERQSK
jgi:hypothetical protein